MFALSGMKCGKFRSSKSPSSYTFQPRLQFAHCKTSLFPQTQFNSPTKRNFSFEIVNLTAAVAFPLFYATTFFSSIHLYRKTIFYTSRLTPSGFAAFQRELLAKEPPRPFTRDIEISTITSPGNIRKGTFKVGFNFPTRATTKFHLMELGFNEESIDNELAEYSEEEQVDVSTIIQKLIEKEEYPVYPNQDRNLYSIFQHHTFIVQPEAAKSMIAHDDIGEDEKIRGIFTVMHLSMTPPSIPNFQKIINKTILTAATLPPLTACLLYAVLFSVISPVTFAAHPIICALVGGFLMAPLPLAVAQIQNAMTNYSDQRQRIEKKLDLCALLPHSTPEKMYRKKFSFVPDSHIPLQNNGIKISPIRNESKSLVNGFVTFFTTSEKKIPNIPAWRFILAEKKDTTMSYFICYFFIILLLGYLVRHWLSEEEDYPYHLYKDDEDEGENEIAKQ